LESILLLQLKNSVMLGCQYSLIAVGFTLFFGVLNVVVFCHGDFVAVFLFLSSAAIAGVLALSLVSPLLTGALILLIVFAAMALTGALGVLVERSTIRPLRRSNPFMPLLVTAAVGIVMQQAFKIFYPQGSNPQMFPLELGARRFALGGLSMSAVEILIVAMTAVLFLLVFLLIHRTRIGLQIQAISQDFEAAAMMGIDVNRGIAITFFVGAALAAVAGFMNGLYYSVFRYDMGGMGGIKGFSAAVVGGLGSVFGAVMGGFVMAFVETLAAAYIPGATPYRDVFSFLVVLLFLAFRPSGILGRTVREKV